MRVKHSLLNISAGIGNQLIITALSFFSRTVFINTLGVEYLGVNGLLTSILAILSLAEAGIGSSIIYNLYKPVAENDMEKTKVLMRVYRNAYLVIALVVFGLGLSLLPFLEIFIKDTSVKNVHLIYLIFLLNSVLPYLFLHKNSFLNVAQKGYIVTGLYTVSSIISTGLKVFILLHTQNYILYLVIESAVTITTTITLAIIVDKMYPYLKEKVTGRLDLETKNRIVKNVKAIVIQNIGSYLVLGTDNLIISSFVSVAAVGLYSNYCMLIDICRNFAYQISNNIYHSVGNLVAKESTEKIYSIYKVSMLVNFWLYSSFIICLFLLIEPFITLWIGKEYLMSNGILIILLLLFFERGMRNSISMVKTTSGIFHEDRYSTLIQAGINLVVSILLVKTMGIIGVFIGTLVSVLAVPFWLTPKLVYKMVFQKPIKDYYKTYLKYTCTGLMAFVVVSYISNLLPTLGIVFMIIKGMIGVIVPFMVYVAVFWKTEELKYLITVINSLVVSIISLKLQRKSKIKMMN